MSVIQIKQQNSNTDLETIVSVACEIEHKCINQGKDYARLCMCTAFHVLEAFHIQIPSSKLCFACVCVCMGIYLNHLSTMCGRLLHTAQQLSVSLCDPHAAHKHLPEFSFSSSPLIMKLSWATFKHFIRTPQPTIALHS